MRECIYYMRMYIHKNVYILYENIHICESMWSRTLRVMSQPPPLYTATCVPCERERGSERARW
jgi:hypothetical protein